jgi:hypothetical protein
MYTTTTVKKAERKGKVRSVTITIAENGFTVNCDREPVKTKGNACNPCGWEPSKPAVFDGPDAGAKALDYVARELKIDEEAAEAA